MPGDVAQPERHGGGHPGPAAVGYRPGQHRPGRPGRGDRHDRALARPLHGQRGEQRGRGHRHIGGQQRPGPPGGHRVGVAGGHRPAGHPGQHHPGQHRPFVVGPVHHQQYGRVRERREAERRDAAPELCLQAHALSVPAAALVSGADADGSASSTASGQPARSPLLRWVAVRTAAWASSHSWVTTASARTEARGRNFSPRGTGSRRSPSGTRRRRRLGEHDPERVLGSPAGRPESWPDDHPGQLLVGGAHLALPDRAGEPAECGASPASSRRSGPAQWPGAGRR